MPKSKTNSKSQYQMTEAVDELAAVSGQLSAY
jgi:hypothetical protein